MSVEDILVGGTVLKFHHHLARLFGDGIWLWSTYIVERTRVTVHG